MYLIWHKGNVQYIARKECFKTSEIHQVKRKAGLQDDLFSGNEGQGMAAHLQEELKEEGSWLQGQETEVAKAWKPLLLFDIF